MTERAGGDVRTKSRILVPLSLVINPELPAALLGKKPGGQNEPQADQPASQSGDGLSTGMSLPSGEAVVNMANLDRDEFVGLIASAGLHKKS